MFSTQVRLTLALIAGLTSACGVTTEGQQVPDPLGCRIEGERRCDGNNHQVCIDGKYQTELECSPTEQCDVNQLCVGTSECPGGSDLIYAVDTAGHLLSFNPRHELFRFHEVGELSCPAGPALPSHGSGPGRPNSMAVARNARAFVTYSSGEVFLVDTGTASCQPTSIRPAAGGFSLFGMGFVSDGAGLQTEKLYIAGVTQTGSSTASLGQLDTGTSQVKNLGFLQPWMYQPELTGTGAGELFAYFPGTDSSLVAQIDKQNRAYTRTWALPGLSGSVLGWAFAHWGGMFYIFVSTERQGQHVNEVIRFDRTNGSRTVVVSNSPYSIVGAGVSTCAPYTVG